MSITRSKPCTLRSSISTTLGSWRANMPSRTSTWGEYMVVVSGWRACFSKEYIGISARRLHASSVTAQRNHAGRTLLSSPAADPPGPRSRLHRESQSRTRSRKLLQIAPGSTVCRRNPGNIRLRQSRQQRHTMDRITTQGKLSLRMMASVMEVLPLPEEPATPTMRVFAHGGS